MKKIANQSRRDFLGNGALAVGAAASSTLPLSGNANEVEALARHMQGKPSEFAYHPDVVDPALESFPGYAAKIDMPPAQQVSDAAHNILDTQLGG